MIQKFYVIAWFLLIGSAVVTTVTGSLDPLSLVALSLGTVALVYGLALWAAFRVPHAS